MVYILWLLLSATVCSALLIPIYHEKAPDLQHHGLDAHHQRGWNHVGKVHPRHHGKRHNPSFDSRVKRQVNKGIDEKLDDINRDINSVVDGITDLLKDILKSKNEGNKVKDETSSSEAPSTKIISNPFPNHRLTMANVAQVSSNIENKKSITEEVSSNIENKKATTELQNSSVVNIKSPVDVASLNDNNNKPKATNQFEKVNAAINTNKVVNVIEDINIKEQQINANASPVRTKRFSNYKLAINHDIIKEAVDRIQQHRSGVVKRQVAKPEFEVKHNKRHLKNPFLDTWKLKVNPARNHKDKRKRRHHLKARVHHSNF